MLTDPPYNISTDFSIEFPDRSDIKHSFGEWDRDNVLPDDWVPLTVKTLTVTGTFISLYDNRNIHKLIQALKDQGLEIRQKAYWHKQNPVPQIYGVKWQEAIEELVIATVNQGRGHNFQNHLGQRHNVIETPICQGQERKNHPTQKPKKLLRPFIKWWTQPHDLVLDPFAGAGTTCKAAQELNRHYLGIEKQNKHVKTARHRLNQKTLCQF